MRVALFLFILVVFTSTNLSGSIADSHSSDEEPANEEVAAKLSIKLPSNFGIVPYDEDGTMLYMVTKPSTQVRGIFLSMNGSAGCLYSPHGAVQDEEDLISNGGPSKTHPAIMVRGTNNWTDYGLKVIHPNCPDIDFDSTDSTYTSAINKILVKENPNNLPVFVSGLSRGSIRAVNIASRLGQNIRGTIILSGSTDDTYDGTMFDPPIEEANSSFLLMIHTDDQCSSSMSFDGLKSFMGDLTGVKDKKIVELEGGKSSSGSGRRAWCNPRSHHGFQGIHDKVLEIMKSWILKKM